MRSYGGACGYVSAETSLNAAVVAPLRVGRQSASGRFTAKGQAIVGESPPVDSQRNAGGSLHVCGDIEAGAL